jgi:hypothetical protein
MVIRLIDRILEIQSGMLGLRYGERLSDHLQEAGRVQRVFFHVCEYFVRVMGALLLCPCIVVVALIPRQSSSDMFWAYVYELGRRHFARSTGTEEAKDAWEMMKERDYHG